MSSKRVTRTLGTGFLVLWAAAATAASVEPSRQAGTASPTVAAPSPTAPAGVTPPKTQPSIVQLLKKGGPVMYPLYLCSMLTLAFAIERAVSLRRRRVAPQPVADMVRAALGSTNGGFDSKALLASLETDPAPLARIAVAGLRRTGSPLLEVEKAMEDAAAKEVNKLQRNNRVLSSVASVAPLLGLLGTATGIIRTFMTVAATEEALGRTELLAGGIYEALVATAVGLTIAIIALVLYFFYQERVDRLVSDLDDLATDLAVKLAGSTRTERAS